MLSWKKYLKSKKNIIYQDDTGYIKGYLRQDGYYWIEEIVVKEDLRGQGFGRKLAQHLPQKSKLLAQPMFNLGNVLDKVNLIKFYESLGFKQTKDEFDNIIMVRD